MAKHKTKHLNEQPLAKTRLDERLEAAQVLDEPIVEVPGVLDADDANARGDVVLDVGGVDGLRGVDADDLVGGVDLVGPSRR